MLMDIKCAPVTSIRVKLSFDDNSCKDCIISTGDIINAVYNGNGIRKVVEGKVLKVSAVGTDPKAWYIIVDGSDDFGAAQAKFSPMSILDIEIIRKADTVEVVKTVVGEGGVPYLRVVSNRLQWSKDGSNWNSFCVDSRDIIEDQEGTVPVPPGCESSKDNNSCGCGSNDGIQDAEW